MAKIRNITELSVSSVKYVQKSSCFCATEHRIAVFPAGNKKALRKPEGL
jgi:hypothetical protein